MARNIPVSVRISQEDAEFISNLRIDGANTPSDKIRAIITDARKKNAIENTFSSRLFEFQQLINTINIQEIEFEHNVHSEFIELLNNWLPNMMAFFVSNQPSNSNIDFEELKAFEKMSCERLNRLIESVFYISSKTGNVEYNKNLFAETVANISELATKLNDNNQKEKI